MYELLLVSQSPRRRQILENFGFLFRVDTVKVSEIIEENVNLPLAVSRVAQTKAEAYLEHNNHLKSQGIILLSADTIVVLNGCVYGKPRNQTEAEEFLHHLSGKIHSVITGFCLKNLKTDEEILDFCTTEVEFRDLSPAEIINYVKSGEPMDKAGAYAIQGHGRAFVKNFNGSLHNVVGLPIEEIDKKLKEKNWHVARKSN